MARIDQDMLTLFHLHKDKLSLREKEVFQRHFIEKETYTAISKSWGLSIPRSRTICNRAKRKLYRITSC